MITEREQEILLLIRQDPLISQQALADRLGITRSAVAGHIMNLTNKGGRFAARVISLPMRPTRW